MVDDLSPDDLAFERYRVSMFRRQRPKVAVPKIGSVPLGVYGSYPVFSPWRIEGVSTDVSVNQRRVFNGDMLRAHFGEKWPAVLARELTQQRKTFLRIDGEDSAGVWHRLPTGDAQAHRLSPPQPAGRTPGLGMNTLVRHLGDIEGMKNYDVLLRMFKESGDSWVLDWLEEAGTQRDDRVYQHYRLRRAFGNGKKPHELACPYCVTGLPEPWRTLVPTYK